MTILRWIQILRSEVSPSSSKTTDQMQTTIGFPALIGLESTSTDNHICLFKVPDNAHVRMSVLPFRQSAQRLLSTRRPDEVVLHCAGSTLATSFSPGTKTDGSTICVGACMNLIPLLSRQTTTHLATLA
ncbi:hypothetical protein BC938DRAFT_473514 [Jimgerdemannia flammicorona]|uniref:Uncharacterized protein n=1 Tax=Jimgerdemannia flammicorona TaxID=994334 RepID=A0A433Q422_9FUNG|nr:hypothetical protein BC938DRAFT_473514 [Jimgerdemannia flammicorona]